ncbi:hypothetical protein BJ875DRAFT_351264, partial [Amylocarpus encephaloides]
DAPIEEERIPSYDLKGFLLVNLGDLLNNRYKIVVKVGLGTTSTVWLAQDTQRYVLARLDAHLSVISSTQVSLRLRLMSIEAHAHSIIDLKLDNILLGFEHPSVFDDFVQK